MVEKRVNNGGTSNKNDTSLRRKQREPMAVAMAISYANFSFYRRPERICAVFIKK